VSVVVEAVSESHLYLLSLRCCKKSNGGHFSGGGHDGYVNFIYTVYLANRHTAPTTFDIIYHSMFLRYLFTAIALALWTVEGNVSPKLVR
jgi:hypothetical protein